MVRNLYFKADDDFDDKLYSTSKKRGMSKASFIRNELEKAIERESTKTTEKKNTEVIFPHISILKEPDEVNVNLGRETQEKKNIATDIIEKRSDGNSMVDDPRKTQEQLRSDEVNLKEEVSKEKIPEEKAELNILKDELKINDNNKRIVIEDQNNNKVKETGIRKKFKIGMVKRVTGEEGTIITEGDIERKVNKLLEDKKFGESFRDMHNKIDSVCEDGKCLKDDMDHLKSKLDKIDSICEDGKCLRAEIGNIKTDLGELKELKKHFDDLNKKIVKREPCPHCNQGIEETSSYCPNCGLEIKEWYDEKGNKLDWKPFKQRSGK